MDSLLKSIEPELPIDSFSGECFFLSNFYPVKLNVDQITYPTLEHAYQAAKTLTFEDRVNISKAETPALAKQMGKLCALRPNWNDVKLKVMIELVTLKFEDPALRKMLLRTAPKELIEGNWWGDTYWGVCKGKGSNHLGKILMKIRSELNHV